MPSCRTSLAAGLRPCVAAAAVDVVGVACRMFIGQPSDAALQLVEVTRQSLQAAIDVCGPGVPFRAIGSAISSMADKAGKTQQRKLPAAAGTSILWEIHSQCRADLLAGSYALSQRRQATAP